MVYDEIEQNSVGKQTDRNANTENRQVEYFFSKEISSVSNENSIGTPIYTYGPIIHNDEVVKDFERNGVVVVKKLEELDTLQKGKTHERNHHDSK